MPSVNAFGSAATFILVAGVIEVADFFVAEIGLVTLERAESITDQAALEAADAASGRIPGYPCNRAERLAEKNSFQIENCEVQGLIVRVTLQVTVLGISTHTRAKAGPQNELE